MLKRRHFLGGLLALPFAAACRAAATPASYRLLVILAGFPDRPPPYTGNEVAARFARLGAYVREMSDGRRDLAPTLSEWYTLPAPVARYAISPANRLVDRNRVWRVIQDSLDAADADHDFAHYDYVALFLGAHVADYGMIGLCGYPGMLGWEQEIVFRSKSGQRVPGGLAIFSASAHPGTLFHDSAHVWGGVRGGRRGVPCLYDHELQMRYPNFAGGWGNALINLGYWDPMSCHFARRDQPPPGISAWTRCRLGWLDATAIATLRPGQDAAIELAALADPAGAVRAIRIPVDDQRFLLIENRQPCGTFDPYLPGHGVLLMHCNDAIDECHYGRTPVRLVNADPGQPFLNGAAFSLASRSEYSDPASGLRLELRDAVGQALRLRLSWQEGGRASWPTS